MEYVSLPAGFQTSRQVSQEPDRELARNWAQYPELANAGSQFSPHFYLAQNNCLDTWAMSKSTEPQFLAKARKGIKKAAQHPSKVYICPDIYLWIYLGRILYIYDRPFCPIAAGRRHECALGYSYIYKYSNKYYCCCYITFLIAGVGNHHALF